ncbi:MAG: AEC family transporter [Spirochaetaceae bacterium]|jgi:predicted permease|nr:AEC family transporter [Spirochaetaceae bacterium]
MIDLFLFGFNAVSPLFIIMFLGWFIARRGLVGDGEISFLNALCFRYLLPIYIFSNVLSVEYSVDFKPKLFAAFIVCDTALLLGAIIVFSFLIKDRHRRCIYIINSFRTNNLIYALPLAANLFGAEGLKVAAMLVPFTIITFNLYSVAVMVYYAGAKTKTGSAEIKRTLIEIVKNPLIIGSAAGLAVALLEIELPVFLVRGVSSIGSAATPLSLLLLGAQIDFTALKNDLRHSLCCCAARLVICPLITTPVLVFLGFRGAELSALAIAFAAPTAIATSLMARNYNIMPQFAAQTVYLSTLVSIFTIFFLVLILRGLSFF